MIPRVRWPHVAARVQRTWLPRTINPHQVIYGQSRAGKDHLIRYGLLPLKPAARVLVLDIKRGGDPMWNGWGDDVPLAGWTPALDARRVRVLMPGTDDQAARLAARLLETVAAIGEHVLVMPDAGRITEPRRRGGLALDGPVARLMNEGAVNGITVLAGLNSPTWAEASFKHQAGRVWLGFIVHADGRTAFAEAAGLPKGPARDQLAALVPGDFIYADYIDGPRLAVTRAPGAAQ